MEVIIPINNIIAIINENGRVAINIAVIPVPIKLIVNVNMTTVIIISNIPFQVTIQPP